MKKLLLLLVFLLLFYISYGSNALVRYDQRDMIAYEDAEQSEELARNNRDRIPYEEFLVTNDRLRIRSAMVSAGKSGGHASIYFRGKYNIYYKMEQAQDLGASGSSGVQISVLPKQPDFYVPMIDYPQFNDGNKLTPFNMGHFANLVDSVNGTPYGWKSNCVTFARKAGQLLGIDNKIVNKELARTHSLEGIISFIKGKTGF